MSISDLPVSSALRTKMQWHEARQHVLFEDVFNSDTPNFKPSELVEPKFDASGAGADKSSPLASDWKGRSEGLGDHYQLNSLLARAAI